MTRKVTIELTCPNDENPDGLLETDLALTFTPDISPDELSNVRVMAIVMLHKLNLPVPEGLYMSPIGMEKMRKLQLTTTTTHITNTKGTIN